MKISYVTPALALAAGLALFTACSGDETTTNDFDNAGAAGTTGQAGNSASGGQPGSSGGATQAGVAVDVTQPIT